MLKRLLRGLLLTALVAGGISFAAPLPAMASAGCAALSIEQPITPECEAEMAAHPEPNVLPMAPDLTALAQYTFMRLQHGEEATEPVIVRDGPDGEIIGAINPGFNFVTARQQVGDWVEINEGEWVNSDDVQVQRASRFAGVQIVEPLTYPLAWILINTYTVEVPGGPQIIDPARLHRRYERLNVYATVEVDGHNWYLIGPHEWVYHTWVAIAKPTPRPEGVGGRWVAVDLYEQTLVAYEEDRMVYATLVSSGLPDWSTNEGLFHIWARLQNDYMTGAEGASDFYYLENVPYVMYFDGDISLHGTYWHDGFGYRHSHGCVNLSITDAKWLFDWTNSEAFAEAPVYVYSSGQY